MKNFFTTIISIMLSLGIIGIIVVIAIIAWKEFKDLEAPPEVQQQRVPGMHTRQAVRAEAAAKPHCPDGTAL